MKQITRHPLFTAADMLKRSFILNGFHLFDDSRTQEVLPAEQNQKVYSLPEEVSVKPILLDEGRYVLRTGLLLTQLHKMKGETLKEIICGRIYDGNDKEQPNHLYIEGVYAEPGMIWTDYQVFWSNVAAEVYGAGTEAELQPLAKDVFKIVIHKEDGKEVVIGYTGAANWLAKSLLGKEENVWMFSVDVDQVAMDLFDMKDRSQLYCNQVEKLKEYKNSAPAYGNDFLSKVTDALRQMGYIEYIGPKVYTADAYIKMNMFQDAWDRNNKGLPLVEPHGDRVATPTVLTPGLEQVLGENYSNPEETVKIFEIAHTFVPGAGEDPPEEKLFLAIGGYGPDLDPMAFKADMDEFLTRIGIRNHFFIPTGVPIPYKPGECWLVLDEKPGYLGGNFGGICKLSEDNFGIGVHACMANMELPPLEEKAASEYGFIPPELG